VALGYTAASYLFGVGGGVDESALRASALYGTLPEHTAAFRWLDNQSDALVAQHVLDARARVHHAVDLVLVADGVRETPSDAIECADLFATDDDRTAALQSLFYHAARYLRANADERCVCAPQFGHRVRYAALRSKHDRELARMVRETRGDGALEMLDADNAVYHMLNPTDSVADAYDALDANALAHLTVTRESQPTRYNDAARGNHTFAVVRRDALRVELMDRQCHTQVVQLKGPLAHCMQRCLDQLRGISVRERAERQRAHGVALNDALLADAPERDAPQTRTPESSPPETRAPQPVPAPRRYEL